MILGYTTISSTIIQKLYNPSDYDSLYISGIKQGRWLEHFPDIKATVRIGLDSTLMVWGKDEK